MSSLKNTSKQKMFIQYIIAVLICIILYFIPILIPKTKFPLGILLLLVYVIGSSGRVPVNEVIVHSPNSVNLQWTFSISSRCTFIATVALLVALTAIFILVRR